MKIAIMTSFTECQNLLYYTTQITNFFYLNNYEIVSVEKADVIVLTGCAFLDITEQQALDYYNDLKEKYPDKLIIPAGCFVKIAGIKGVGPKDLHEFNDRFPHQLPIENVRAGILNAALTQNTNSPYKGRDCYYIKIAQGCVNKCSYCAIKKAKGYVKSRPIDDIVLEIKEAILNGFSHFILLADDCGSYGIDIGSNIADLLNAVCEIPGIKINVHYFEPNAFVKYFDKINPVVWKKIFHLNIPLQTTSQRLIKKMNRHYNVEDVCSLILKIKNDNENIYILTHVIYGFPTETREEFEDCFSLVEYFGRVCFFEFAAKKDTLMAKEESLPREEIIYRRNRVKKMVAMNPKIGLLDEHAKVME